MRDVAPSNPNSPLNLQFRDQLNAACLQMAAGKTALLLSGGLDSGAILAACMQTGVKVDCFSITLGPHLNQDARYARVRAEHFRKKNPDLSFEVLHVPRTFEATVKTVEWCIDFSGASLKTAIEVMVMVKPAVEELKRRGYQTILNGMTGGVLWGLGKEDVFARSRDGEIGWQKVREENLAYEYSGFPPNATRVARGYCQDLGMTWVDPLASLSSLLLECTFAEMHRPKQKGMVLAAYPDLALTPHEMGGLQVQGGVREYCQLIASQQGFKTAQGWYNKLAAQRNIPVRGRRNHARWSKADPKF